MALTLNQRIALFLVGCMGTRALLVYLAATVSLGGLKAMAVLASAAALGFAVIYFGGLRQTGAETGGQPIWWNSLRPVHALMYAAFAYFAWTGQRRPAWIILLVDLVVGLASFTYQHRGTLF